MPNRNLPYRKPIRMKGWDYRNPGLYFITICTKDRKPHFGEIRDGIMGLSVPGCVAHYYWTKISDKFPSILLDEHIIMPNHIHGIVGITGGHEIKPVGSSIHGDPNHHGDRGGDTDRGSDAMNRVPTGTIPTESDPVGPPIYRGRTRHRDPNNNASPNQKSGGATLHHNPMLYQTHLGNIIRWYKGRCTFEIRKRGYSDFAWQSRFYDHIIRNDRSLDRIRDYIFDNPLRWDIDREHPDRVHERGVEYMVQL